MATRIVMPQLGESVTEGTITRWLKKEGEWVDRDEAFVELMTDKVNAEIPAPVAGVLVKHSAPEGTKLAVGQELAIIDEQAREAQSAIPASGQSTKPLETAGGPSSRVSGSAQEIAVHAFGHGNGAEGGRYSPLVRRLAREHGIELIRLRGSGIGGRVTKDDVLRAVAEQRAAAQAPPAPAAVSAAVVQAPPVEPGASPAGEEVITPSAMRLAIAEHMVRSKQTAPHAWTVVEVDMTRLVRWREEIKGEFERREGVALTYVPFVIKAAVAALKETRAMNAAWVADKIVLKKQINIGVAVALDDGLLVPVIHNADNLSVAGLAKAVADLSTRARAGRLVPGDVQGGTFTVNNPGAFGSIVSMPIINQGQAGILAMEAIVKRPVVVDDAIAVRSMMNLDLSFDHRVVDGLTVGKFLRVIKSCLEAYGPDTPIY